MILTHEEIIAAEREGRISVYPWNDKNVGTNSYDVTLGETLLVYTQHIIDPRKRNATQKITLHDDGFLVTPGQFYIGATHEHCQNIANNLVPMIEGRSSIARLGISAHIAAGFGDIGFCGTWTLEITVAHPTLLFPRMPIAQLYWLKCQPSKFKYQGKYTLQREPTASRLFEEY